MGKTILTAKHITKLFPGMKALDNVDFDLREGEVHILVGENGAGKSTLAKVILGAYKAEEGEITFDNEIVKFNGTKDALAKGIVAVYQEFTLVPYITVAQNIFLNREYKNKFGLIDHKRMEKEAAELLYGIQPIKSGKVYIKGDEVHPKSPIQATKLGIGLVSEDRKKQGLALDESIALNTVAVSLKKIFPRFFISNKKIKEIALDYKKQLRIATTSVNKACKYLSGGNQQKVVLAKWLSFDPDILIFDEPTRGIDVAAKMEIYGLMDKLALQGKAIIMISSELPEVIGMSDRIYIMHEGEIVDEVKRGTEEFNSEAIGARMMLGAGGADDGES